MKSCFITKAVHSLDIAPRRGAENFDVGSSVVDISMF